METDEKFEKMAKLASVASKKLMEEWRTAEKSFPYKENKFVKFEDNTEQDFLKGLVKESREHQKEVDSLLKERFDKRYRPNVSGFRKAKVKM